MNEKYLVSKNVYNGNIIFNSEIKGYQFLPKNNYDYGMKINEVVVIKKSLIEKIIKRKIRNKLDVYLQYLIEHFDDDSDDSRVALGDLERYRIIVNRKYSPYLNDKYLTLLNKKLDVIERELKSNIIYSELDVEEIHKSR